LGDLGATKEMKLRVFALLILFSNLIVFYTDGRAVLPMFILEPSIIDIVFTWSFDSFSFYFIPALILIGIGQCMLIIQIIERIPKYTQVLIAAGLLFLSSICTGKAMSENSINLTIISSIPFIIIVVFLIILHGPKPMEPKEGE